MGSGPQEEDEVKGRKVRRRVCAAVRQRVWCGRWSAALWSVWRGRENVFFSICKEPDIY